MKREDQVKVTSNIDIRTGLIHNLLCKIGIHSWVDIPFTDEELPLDDDKEECIICGRGRYKW